MSTQDTREGELTARERGAIDAVDTAAITTDLQWFAQRGLRLAGTPAEHAGAAYVRDRLQAAGIACELEAYDGWVSYGDVPEQFGPATVTLPDGSVLAGKIYAFGGSTPTQGVSAELVWVGAGTPEDVAAVDLRGRIALSQLSMDAPHGEPVRCAGEAGALGIVIANWSDAIGRVVHTGTARGIWGNPTPQDLHHETRIPVVAVAHADGVRLRALADGGGTVRLDVRTHARWARSVQPIAEIRGVTTDFALVYCHLDTYGAGMTDNTTGVVGLMELARRLHARRHELTRGVRLAWFAGHEMPYNGSTFHLDANWDGLRENCVAVVNADSWAIDGSLDSVLTWSFAEAEAFAVTAADAVLGAPTAAEDFDAREAEQSFWALGIPSWMAFSIAEHHPGGMAYLGPYWHSEQDVLDYVDQPALAQLTAVYTLSLLRLCTAATLPFLYSTLATRLQALLAGLQAAQPGAVAWAGLLAAAARFAAAADRAEAAVAAGTTAPTADARLKATARAINPVVYTVGGHYAQDPSSASHLRKRLPGLQRALAGIAAADAIESPAWRTVAMRERNRTTDALLRAAAELEGI